MVIFFSFFITIYPMDEHQNLNPNEGTQLIPHVVMNEESDPFFDESRRYYDTENHEKAQARAATQCCYKTICYSALAGGCGALLGVPLTCALFGMGVTKGIFIKCAGGVLIESCTICGCTSVILACPVMGITEAALTESEIANDPNLVTWQEELNITNEMLESANAEKNISFSKSALQSLLERAVTKTCFARNDFPWLCFKKLISCYYMEENKIIEQIQKRIEATQVDTILVSEKELLCLIRDLSHEDNETIRNPIIRAYASQALLEANGWIAFKESAKYPTRVEMKYFDAERLPDTIKKWYCHEHGQTIFLPTKPEKLIGYYKINEDPAYTTE